MKIVSKHSKSNILEAMNLFEHIPYKQDICRNKLLSNDTQGSHQFRQQTMQVNNVEKKSSHKAIVSLPSDRSIPCLIQKKRSAAYKSPTPRVGNVTKFPHSYTSFCFVTSVHFLHPTKYADSKLLIVTHIVYTQVLLHREQFSQIYLLINARALFLLSTEEHHSCTT